MTSAWTVSSTLSLIKDLESNPCLWDARRAEYRDRALKTETYEELAKKYHVPAQTVEKKMQALKNQFRREHKRVLGRRGHQHPYKPQWFGYQGMSFLQGYEPKKGDDEDDYEDVAESLCETVISGGNNSVKEENLPADGFPYIQHNDSPEDRSSLLKSLACIAEVLARRDEFTAFGEHVANSLRVCDRSRNELIFAQHQISKVLLDLSTGRYAGNSDVHDIKPERLEE